MKSSHFRFSIYCLRMGAIFASFATVLPFGLSLDAGAGALRFDMGSGDSPVRPGYTRVSAQTDYAAEQGYGWAATEGLADADYAAPQASAPIFADALLRDFVFAERPATFKLKVANGTYGVFLVCGAAHVAFDPPFFDVTVRLEGNEVGKLAIPQP
ncbi:MAG: hypothetical protein FJ272_01800, partial [Planctomycetes bacterium]|nr:hypothetical protein [Planctomycetota bacterium]